MFGDWLRFDLGFLAEETAEMAADSEDVFESEYITHPTVFDATDRWTKKNTEIRSLHSSEKDKRKDAIPDNVIQVYKSEIATMRETIKTQAETIKQLAGKTQ